MINSFKGLKDVEFSDCGDINIIVGDNNTCKTSVLEAVQLLKNPLNFREVLRIARKRDIAARIPRGLSALDSFLNMFNINQEEPLKEMSIDFKAENKINVFSLIGQFEEVYMTNEEIKEMYKQIGRIYFSLDDEHDESIPIKMFSGEIKFNDFVEEVITNEILGSYGYIGEKKNSEDLFNIDYLSSVDHINERFSTSRITEAILNNEKSGLLDLIQLFDENIDGLEVLGKENSSRQTTYIRNKGERYLPISSYGDGLKKVLALSSALLRVDNGILLIDEIETAIHTSALRDVFLWLMTVTKKQNNQIFLTTHSDEALRSFLENNIDSDLDLNIVVYRLENIENRIIARRFSEEKATRIILDNGGDLR